MKRSYFQRILGTKTAAKHSRAKAKRIRQFEMLESRQMLSATVYGDFNGDRLEDVAIGLPFEDVGTIQDAGIVRVIYGSSSKGLQSFGDQVLHQNIPGTKEDAEARDYFGTELSAGDFNGDGFDDLAVGVPGEDLKPTNLLGTPGASLPGQPFCQTLSQDTLAAREQSKGCDAGLVHVFYGSQEKGVQAFGDQLWYQGAEGIKETPDTHEKFGSVLGAGDFNGDGTEDLAIGVPTETVGDRLPCTGATCDPAHEGVVQVLYGSRAKGLQSFGDQIFHQNTEGLREKDLVEPFDQFGSALGVGDFNGDGRADLAIGVPQESLGTIRNAGAVHVIYGSLTNGLQSFGDQFWHQNSEGLREKERPEADDFFGMVLTAGDFNGDGRADLAVGVPMEDLGTVVDAGVVQIIYGSQAKGLQSFGDQIRHQNSDGLREKEVAEAQDRFGTALAARDFNRDGTADLAVGVPYEDIGAIVNAGIVQVLYGSKSLGIQTFGDQIWHQNMEQVTGAEIKDSAEAQDLFGYELAAGDFNGDGNGDLAVRIPGERTVDGDGLLNVIYGTQSQGLHAFGDQLWCHNSQGLKVVADERDNAPISPTRPTSAPVAPASLAATGVTTTGLQLTWTDVAHEDGYRVEYWNGSTWIEFARLAANAMTTPVTNLTPGATYYFRVGAYNSLGTSYTNYITVKMPTSSAPTAPGGLKWVAQSTTQGQLSWSDVANETGYRVEYWNGTAWVEFARLGANVTTTTVTKLTPGATYYFRVGAYNSVGTSYTNYLTATTAPAAPAGLTWTPQSVGKGQLSWQDVAGETGSRVEYWNGTAWVEITRVGANVTKTSITNLTRGATYYFRVGAYNSAGTTYSNYLTVKA